MDWKDGFTRYKAVPSVPSMSVTKNGISFNQAAVVRMGKAPFARLYFDEEGRRFAIEACAENEEGALLFYRGGKLSKGVRWNNGDLKSMLERIMGRGTEYNGFRVRGEFHAGPPAALEFRLAEAEALHERRG